MADETRKQPESLICASCGAPLRITDPNADFVTCDYCGTTFSMADILNESDEVRSARYWSDAYRETEASKLENQRKKEAAAARAAAIRAANKRGRTGQKFLVGLIFFLVLITLGSFFESIPAGIIALLGLALIIAAWVLGRSDKPKVEVRQPLRIAAITLAFVLMVPWSIAVDEAPSSPPHTVTDIAWSDVVLSAQMPEFDFNTGYVYTNTQDRFNANFANVTEAQFTDYVSACRASGYTIEPVIRDHSFTAFNKDGYMIDLYYYSSMNEMDIEVTAPKHMVNLIWPSGTIADVIPPPPAENGFIESATQRNLSIFVSPMTKQQTSEYMQACIDAGFTVVSLNDTRLSAEKDNNYVLYVTYRGNNVMEIALYTKNTK